MEKVIDTIKLSCEDLKKKEIIDQSQYTECIELTKRQKWRTELKDEKYKKKVDKIIQAEMAKYKKYKKLIDINFKRLEESYILSLSNDNDIHAKNTQKYLKNLDKLNEELKLIIVDYQKSVYKKESFNLFRELVAKKSLNKNYMDKVKTHEKDLAFIRKKNSNLQEADNSSQIRYIRLSVLLAILLLCNAVLVFLFLRL